MQRIFIRSGIFLVFFFLFSVISYGQPWLYNIKQTKSTGSISFSEKQVAFNKYWKNKPYEKGKGYKQFRRHELFLEPRINNNSNINTISYWNALNSITAGNAPDTLIWKYVGPSSAPVGINNDNKSGNGRLNCIAFHPVDDHKLYVGAPSGGLWFSEDYGANWKTTTDKLNAIGISDICVTLDDTVTNIYLATGDGDAGDTYGIGIIKSVDNGNSWTSTALSLNATNGIYFRRIVSLPSDPKTMLATSSRGIYKTTDAWASYSLVQTGDFKDIELNPGNDNIIYATSFSNSGNANIYRSTNKGSSFAISNDGMSVSGLVSRIELATTENSSAVVYALCCSAEDSGFQSLYRSNNNGVSWSLIYDDNFINLLGWTPGGTDIGGQGWYDLAMAVSPSNSNKVLVGGINLWRSVNGGTDWALSSWLYHSSRYEYVHADQHFLVYSPHNSDVFCANDGGIYRSDDDGRSWTDISSNLEILQTYKLGSSENGKDKLICGNQDNGTFLYNNNQWNMVLGGDGMFCYIDPESDDIIYATGYNGEIYKSTDNGNEFNNIKPENNLTGAWVTPFIMHPLNSSVLYAAYNDVYKSTDKGETWVSLSNGLSSETFKSLAVAPSNDNYIYAATYNHIYKTTNNGASWEELSTSFSEYSITSICISPNDPNKIWVSLSGYEELDKIYYSGNGGASWSNYSNGIPNIPVNDIVVRYNSNNELFAATDVGIFYRNTDMSEWVNYSHTLPNVIVTDIEIIEPLELIRVATYGRGIWEAELPPAIPSKANFEANIISGCLDAPIKLFYEGSLSFDSLAWYYSDGTLVSESPQKDTIEILYSNSGKKTIELKLYKNDTVVPEIKFEYLDIRDTLDITLSPAQYYVCDSSKFEIALREGYTYSWSPDLYIDTTAGSTVSVSPLANITYQILAVHGNCNTIIDLPILYMPDNVCDAHFIPLKESLNYSNSCAGAQENEPVPPVGTGDYNGCVSADGWCHGYTTIENSLWYKIVVPDNGEVHITVEGIDSQVALYKATTCDDLLNGFYELIAANDDISQTNPGSVIDVLEGLTPGDTLFIQLDGSNSNNNGEFTITVSDEEISSQHAISMPGIDISVYPNPANTHTNISVNNSAGSKIVIELFSQEGQRVYTRKYIAHNNDFKTKLQTENLKGLFILRISSDNKVAIKKLIVL